MNRVSLEKIYSLRKDGRSIREISSAVGVSKTQVQRVLTTPTIEQARQNSNALLKQLSHDIAESPYKILLSVNDNTARKNFLDALLNNVPIALVSDGYQNNTITIQEVLKSSEVLAKQMGVPLIVTTPVRIDELSDDVLDEFDVLLQNHTEHDRIDQHTIHYVSEVTE
jgi:chaperonin GroEL (HSP60 family)